MRLSTSNTMPNFQAHIFVVASLPGCNCELTSIRVAESSCAIRGRPLTSSSANAQSLKLRRALHDNYIAGTLHGGFFDVGTSSDMSLLLRS